VSKLKVTAGDIRRYSVFQEFLDVNNISKDAPHGARMRVGLTAYTQTHTQTHTHTHIHTDMLDKYIEGLRSLEIVRRRKSDEVRGEKNIM
jgi:hypothetical protein